MADFPNSLNIVHIFPEYGCLAELCEYHEYVECFFLSQIWELKSEHSGTVFRYASFNLYSFFVNK